MSAPPSAPSSRRESISNRKDEKVSDEDLKEEGQIQSEAADNDGDKVDIAETKVNSVVKDKGEDVEEGEIDPTNETKSKDTNENVMEVDS